MPVTDGDAVALRPLADVFAIAAAKLIPLAVDVVDDVTLFRPSCFDRGGRHISNFRRSKSCTAFKGAASQSDRLRRHPENRYDAGPTRGHQNSSAHPHRLAFRFPRRTHSLSHSGPNCHRGSGADGRSSTYCGHSRPQPWKLPLGRRAGVPWRSLLGKSRPERAFARTSSILREGEKQPFPSRNYAHQAMPQLGRKRDCDREGPGSGRNSVTLRRAVRKLCATMSP